MYDYTHPADATGLSDAYTTWKSAGRGRRRRRVGHASNVEEANALLDAAGLTQDGDVRKLPDGTPRVLRHQRRLRLVRLGLGLSRSWPRTWRRSASKPTVQTYDFAAWFERVQKGDFDISIGWSTGGPTPFNFYRGLMSEPDARAGRRAEHGELAPLRERGGRRAADAVRRHLRRGRAAEGSGQPAPDDLRREAPAIPLFPGPEWGEYNTTRFTDFPNEENPYTVLSDLRDTRSA